MHCRIALCVGAFLVRDLAALAGMMFIAAMRSLCAGLVRVLREIGLTVRHLRVAFNDN